MPMAAIKHLRGDSMIIVCWFVGNVPDVQHQGVSRCVGPAGGVPYSTINVGGTPFKLLKVLCNSDSELTQRGFHRRDPSFPLLASLGTHLDHS